MKLIVCIKQVPDTTEVKVDPKTHTLIRDGVPSILNPYDQFAIEECVRIKEEIGEGSISVITMGPPQARSALMRCLALGADEAILISDKAFAGSDTWATAYTLSLAIKKIGSFDMVFCEQTLGMVKEQTSAIKELVRVLKYNSPIVISIQKL